MAKPIGRRTVSDEEILDQLDRLADMLRTHCFDLVQKRTERNSGSGCRVPGVLFGEGGDTETTELEMGFARLKAWTSVWDELKTAYIMELAAAGKTNKQIVAKFPDSVSVDVLRDLIDFGVMLGLNDVPIRQERQDEDDDEDEYDCRSYGTIV